MILEGDCVEKMRELDEASIDAIVCDPPYGLEFMGKNWDRLRLAMNVGAGGGTSPDLYAMRDVNNQRAMQEWHQAWATEALRVLKPGGHLLAFGGTRTYHRLACAIEDAGFEIRDSLIWLYGSGFPKSLDVSKAIDKAAGAERENLGERSTNRNRPVTEQWEKSAAVKDGTPFGEQIGNLTPITAPATPEAQKWNGWGTALKPGHEPIVVARKPLSGTVAQNVTEHGTGALNIDGCRVEGTGDYGRTAARADGTTNKGDFFSGLESGELPDYANPSGRWPANVLFSHLPECEQVGVRKVKGHAGYPNGPRGNHNRGVIYGAADSSTEPRAGHADPDGTETIPAYNCAPGCPIAELDEQSGTLNSHSGKALGSKAGAQAIYGTELGSTYDNLPGDSGGASRFFYCAKASRGERNAGLDGFEEAEAHAWSAEGDQMRGLSDPRMDRQQERRPHRNGHPTVKPINLMRWLVRLVTPPGGTVLDPFAGSGTTGVAAVLEGFDFLGIEREAEYAEIARARIEWWSQFPGEDTDEVLIRAGFSERLEREHREAGQMGLL